MAGTWVKKTASTSSKEKFPYCTDAGYEPCGSFIVTVQDSGVGVSAENLRAVFSDGWQFNANMLQVVCQSLICMISIE